MEKTDLTEERYRELSGRILKIITTQGPTKTTMDMIAQRLSISKRTLYEIYKSKDEMIKSVLDLWHEEQTEDVRKIVRNSDNVLDALANILLYHQKSMSEISVDFLRDMDENHQRLRKDIEQEEREIANILMNAIRLGIRQGVFREDANYSVLVPLIRVQMKSLKQMEKYFPPEITLLDAYNTIALGLLRSIATEKGMEIVNKISPRFQNKPIPE